MSKEKYYKSDIIVTYVMSLRKNTKPKLKVFKNISIDTLIDDKLPKLFKKLKLTDYSDYIISVKMGKIPKGVKPALPKKAVKAEPKKVEKVVKKAAKKQVVKKRVTKKPVSATTAVNPNLQKWLSKGDPKF